MRLRISASGAINQTNGTVKTLSGSDGIFVLGGRNGGSITAAQFLKRFVKETPWAHLDIAGVTWSDKDAPTVPKGATAFGLRLLERLVADHYEER